MLPKCPKCGDDTCVESRSVSPRGTSEIIRYEYCTACDHSWSKADAEIENRNHRIDYFTERIDSVTKRAKLVTLAEHIDLLREIRGFLYEVRRSK